MASGAEIRAALDDYQARVNDHARLRKMLRGWTRVIHFVANDTGDVFTVRIVAGEITEVDEGAGPDADVIISATSEDLTDMFWGDLNPAAKYLTGEITVVGSADDVMRIDAMASVLWVDA